MARKDTTPKPVKTRKDKTPPCTCGCGELTAGGLFRPGHDRRWHARLDAGQVDQADLDAIASQVKIKPVKVTANTTAKPKPCNVDCQFALSARCSCGCGGANHFAGWLGGVIEDTEE